MSGDEQLRMWECVFEARLELCSVDPLDPLQHPDPDELESDDLELDDPTIDEAALPELDMEDAEAPVREPGYEDLLDPTKVELTSEADWDDDHSPVDDVGLTIELDSPAGEEEGAQVVDLDVGSLLTSLPSEGTELDLDAAIHERADGSVGLGPLHDMLLPEEDEEHDDGEVGNDERFPVFDDAAERAPRPGSDDELDISPEDLS